MEPKLNFPRGRAAQLVYVENGKSRRVSIGTTDRVQAERLLKIAIGDYHAGRPIGVRKCEVVTFGPEMLWDDFISHYTDYLGEKKPSTSKAQLSRLGFAKEILKCRTLGQAVTHEAQQKLRNGLVKRSKSINTAKSNMESIRAALNWAVEQGWIPIVPKVTKISTARMKVAKGRPLKPDEVRKFLAAIPSVVDPEQVPSCTWAVKFLLVSAMRLEESLCVHWSDPEWIVPDLETETLRIPARLQKNTTEEDIPMIPPMVELLKAAPVKQGFVCEFPNRDSGAVSKTLSEIGESAKIKIGMRWSRVQKNGKRVHEQVEQYASAHDLRRTCIQWMIDAGLPKELVKAVARHASFATTERYYSQADAAKQAQSIRLIVEGAHNAQKTLHTWFSE